MFTCSEQCKAPNNVAVYYCMWYHLTTSGANYHSWTLLLGHFGYTFHCTFPFVNVPYNHCCQWHPVRTIKAYNTTNMIFFMITRDFMQEEMMRNIDVHGCCWLRHGEFRLINQDKHDGRMVLQNCSPVFAASVRWWWIDSFLLQQKLTLTFAWRKLVLYVSVRIHF